jgi:hypothetical protein
LGLGLQLGLLLELQLGEGVQLGDPDCEEGDQLGDPEGVGDQLGDPELPGLPPLLLPPLHWPQVCWQNLPADIHDWPQALKSFCAHTPAQHPSESCITRCCEIREVAFLNDAWHAWHGDTAGVIAR